jgi:hypothetical protein
MAAGGAAQPGRLPRCALRECRGRRLARVVPLGHRQAALPLTLRSVPACGAGEISAAMGACGILDGHHFRRAEQVIMQSWDLEASF